MLVHNQCSDFLWPRGKKPHTTMGDSDGRRSKNWWIGVDGQERHIALLFSEIQYIIIDFHRKEMIFYSLHTHSFNKYLLDINFAWTLWGRARMNFWSSPFQLSPIQFEKNEWVSPEMGNTTKLKTPRLAFKELKVWLERQD